MRHGTQFALVLMMLVSAGLACGLEEPAPGAATLAGCYQVSFLGMMRSTEHVTTWRYRVEQSCAHPLNNWMLELPACASVIDASPSPWESVRPDPDYQRNGIKWQLDTGFERGEFSVVLSGELVPGTVGVGVRGPELAWSEIAGPGCVSSLVIITATVPTPTLAPTLLPTLSPTPIYPTATPVIVQPPAASAEAILVTQSQQTLTYSCSDHAVEVHGNGNVITLLGSCSSITVHGSGNRVYWQSGAPFITNTGNDNIIQKR